MMENITWLNLQEEMKYKRSSGVDFGPVDFVKYAESGVACPGFV